MKTIKILRSKKGVSLLALTLTFLIMAVIVSVLAYSAKDSITISKYKNLENDIALLRDKVEMYYLKNDKLPILKDSENINIEYLARYFFKDRQPNDNNVYYVIDLNNIGGITLNYGSDFFKIESAEDTRTITDVYIVNEQSHHIYYADGVLLDDVRYYTTYKAAKVRNEITVTFDENYYSGDLWYDTTVESNYVANLGNFSSISKIYDNSVKNSIILKFVMGTGTWGPYYSPTYKLPEGTTYTWSVYVKASRNKTIWIGDEQDGEIQVNLTTDWQKITHTFTATNTTHDNTYKAFVFYDRDTWDEGDELYIHSLEIMEGTPNHTTETKKVGNQIGTLPTPTRERYAFLGWYTAPTGGTEVESSTIVEASDITYYAHWVREPD